MNQHQAVTKCINHWADSANFKAVTFNKNCSGLTGNRFEMPNVSYTHPLWAILKRQNHSHMGMMRKTLTSLEDYIGQVLSLSSSAMAGSGSLGSVIVVYNEDGTPKVNEKNEIEIIGAYPDSLLFRGQTADYRLIPKLARKVLPHRIDVVERSLIDEIKRRGDNLIKKGILDDWELLVYVQHFGLATRLLDWTTNPLVALWFACQVEDSNAYIYILRYSEFNLVDLKRDKSPFKINKTRIFKPNLNNERIVAQNGWFTIHSNKNKVGKIIPLDEEEDFKGKLWQIEIPAVHHAEILGKLNILGINQETIYPGIEGTCRYINWMNEIE